MFGIMLAGWGVAVVLAVALIVRGRRGKVLDDHPVCRRCRRDLYGLEQPTICPECGGDLAARRATLVGNRGRRIVSSLAGWSLMTLAVLAVAFVAALLLTPDRAAPHKPTRWLAFESRLDAGRLSAAAVEELRVRLRANALDAEQATAVAAGFLQDQRDLDLPWNPVKGDFVHMARTRQLVSDDDWLAYVERGLAAGIEPRRVVYARPDLPRFDGVAPETRDTPAEVDASLVVPAFVDPGKFRLDSGATNAIYRARLTLSPRARTTRTSDNWSAYFTRIWQTGEVEVAFSPAGAAETVLVPVPDGVVADTQLRLFAVDTNRPAYGRSFENAAADVALASGIVPPSWPVTLTANPDESLRRVTDSPGELPTIEATDADMTAAPVRWKEVELQSGVVTAGTDLPETQGRVGLRVVPGTMPLARCDRVYAIGANGKRTWIGTRLWRPGVATAFDLDKASPMDVDPMTEDAVTLRFEPDVTRAERERGIDAIAGNVVELTLPLEWPAWVMEMREAR